jgi:hypothetical protein
MENLKYPNDARIITKSALDSGLIIGCETNGQPIQFPYSLFGGGGGAIQIATLWGELATSIPEGNLAVGITKRLLNQSNDLNNLILSLADSVFTLGAGLYFVLGSCPSAFTGGSGQRVSRIYLLDNYDDSILLEGSGGACLSTTYAQETLILVRFLSLEEETDCYLAHYSSHLTTNGTGIPTGDGNPEVYSQITLCKLQ